MHFIKVTRFEQCNGVRDGVEKCKKDDFKRYCMMSILASENMTHKDVGKTK